MFSITKLSQTDRSFLVSLANLGKSRSPEASVALARVLTHAMSIPSAPVDHPVLYYKNQNAIAIGTLIADINEMCVLDVKTVQDYCEKFFLYRYNACHPPLSVLAICPDTAVEDFFGVSKAMPREIIDIVKAQSAKICSYVNGFTSIVNTIKRDALDPRCDEPLAVS
jgi:hypothetical protein